MLKPIWECRPYENPRSKMFVKQFYRFLQPNSLITDLGANTGYHSRDLLISGFRVNAIEGRWNRVLMNDRMPPSRFKIFHSDVRNFSVWEECEGCLCCGILYHLNDPADFLKKASKFISKMIIIHTHVALDDEPHFYLSDKMDRDGIDGRLYRERIHPNQNHPWSSIGNDLSFWPTEEGLVKMIGDAGFSQVEKIEVENDAEIMRSRRCYVGVKNRV